MIEGVRVSSFYPIETPVLLVPLALTQPDRLKVVPLFVCLFSTGSSPFVRYIQWVCEMLRLGHQVSLSSLCVLVELFLCFVLSRRVSSFSAQKKNNSKKTTKKKTSEPQCAENLTVKLSIRLNLFSPVEDLASASRRDSSDPTIQPQLS